MCRGRPGVGLGVRVGGAPIWRWMSPPFLQASAPSPVTALPSPLDLSGGGAGGARPHRLPLVAIWP